MAVTKHVRVLLLPLAFACANPEGDTDTGDPPDVCGPRACDDTRCGPQPNGCGGTTQCGPCTPCTPELSCAAMGANCGSLDTRCGEPLHCGDTPAGSSCFKNRLEPYAPASHGPRQGLRLAFPLLTHDHDTSGTAPEVTQTGVTVPRNGFPNMTAKHFHVALSEPLEPAQGFTLSLRVIPLASEEGPVWTSGPVALSLRGDRLEVALSVPGGEMVLRTPELRRDSCNQVVLTYDGNRAALRVQGHLVATAGAPLTETIHDVEFGDHPADLWEIRLYAEALDATAQAELGPRCIPDATADRPDDNLPHALCWAYVCAFWEDDNTATLEEKIYYLQAQEMVYRQNVLNAGMYPHGGLDAYVNGGDSGRDVVVIPGFAKDKTAATPLNVDNGYYWLHENFHAFQGRLHDASGVYGGKWLSEAGASWGATAVIPGVKDDLLGYYTLFPHLPLGSRETADTNRAYDAYAGRWASGGHMYGAHMFFAYLTRHVSRRGDDFMGVLHQRPGRVPTVQKVFELLRQEQASMAEAFTDYSHRVVTWDLPHGSLHRNGEDSSRRRLEDVIRDRQAALPVLEAKAAAAFLTDKEARQLRAARYTAADPVADRKFAVTHDANGTRGRWTQIPDSLRPGAWASSTIRVSQPSPGDYRFAVRIPDTAPAETRFAPAVVVHTAHDGQRIYHRFDRLAPGEEAEVTVTIPDDATAYLVVPSIPEVFEGAQQYPYGYRIIAPGQIAVAPQPLRIYVLAGQSNMEGHGYASEPDWLSFPNADGRGSLAYFLARPADRIRYAHLVDDNDAYVPRDDVDVVTWRTRTGKQAGPLTIGFGAHAETIGPELGFGHLLGNAKDARILLIKVALGGKSLGADFLPPSAGGPGPMYTSLVEKVLTVLDDVPSYVADYDHDAGHVLAGFVWNQGWNDFGNADFLAAYEENLATLIADVRAAWRVPNLPVVIAETGVACRPDSGASGHQLCAAQRAVAERDDLQSTTAFVPTGAYYRPGEVSPWVRGQYHWHGNFESYYLIGEGLGEAMLDLESRR